MLRGRISINRKEYRSYRNNMYSDHTVFYVGSSVIEGGRFFNVCDRIHSESADALIDPEPCHILKLLPDLGISPVKIGLFGEEGVKIVLSFGLIIFPCRAAENAAPVGRCASVLLRVCPDVPVATISSIVPYAGSIL